MNNKTTQIDVLIITAVKDELDVVRELESDWKEKKDNSKFPYFIRKNTDNPTNEFTIAVARPTDMGGDFASNLATRLIIELKPRCLAMVGICAGRRDKVFLGDVIIAERVFSCDGGKLKVFKKENGSRIEEVFQDIKTYNLNPVWKMQAENFPLDWIKTVTTHSRPVSCNYQEEWLGYAIDAFENENGVRPRDRSDRETDCPCYTNVIERLKDKDLICVDGDLKLTDKGKKWITDHKIIYLNGPKHDPKEPKSHVAPIGTGHQVTEDPDLFEIIGRYERNTLGFEMEAAAIGAVAAIEDVDSCIIVKSVSDYGDRDKNDHFREYAIETSYRFLMAFLKENLSPRPKEVPFILPQIDVSTFTGRDEELERLEEMLVKNEGSKICTVFGMSCVGKSALTCHFADKQKANFPDGVIGLRVDGKDADTIAREIARSYGAIIDPDDERDAAAIMQELFGPRRMLLIFDNADDSKTIRSLIPGGGRCAVIVTTRDRNLPDLLDIPTERRIEVLPLPIPDSLRLLESLMGEKRISDEQESAGNIIKLVGRLPLALKIIGATLEMQPWRSLAEYEESLSEESTRLSKLQYPEDVDLNVRASISLSLKLLEPEERDFFSCLSVCAESGFSLQAAMSAGDCDESAVHERLGRLYRFSLLNLSGSNRFVFHSLIYLFARELAADQSLQDVAADRHAHFFIALLKSSDMADHSATSAIAEEIEDIILAARWLMQKEQSDHEFVTRLGTFFSRYGHWQQAVDLMLRFRSLAELDEDWNAVVRLHIQQAKYTSLQGKWSQAETILTPIADILPKIKKESTRKHYEAMWLTSMGGVLRDQVRFDEAEKTLLRSIDIDEKLGNKRGMAMTLNILGGVLRRQGHFDEAEKAFRDSIDIRKKLNDDRGLAKVLNSLGGVLKDQGHLDEAEKAFRDSIEIGEELGDKHLAMTLNSLGGVLQRQGHLDEAENTLQRSMNIRKKLGDEHGLAMILNSLGGVLQRQGHFDEAVGVIQRSHDLFVEMGDQRGQAMTLNSLGGVLQRQGHLDEAEKAFRDSIDIGEKLGDRRHIAMTLNSLGGVLQRQGHLDEAEKAFRDSIDIGEKLGDRHHIAMTLNSLGGVLQRQGHLDEAEKTLLRSIGIDEKLGNKHGLAMTLNSLGGVLKDQGHLDEAEKAFRDSIEIGEELGDKHGLAMTLNSLGGVLQRQGHLDEAENTLQRSMNIRKKLGDEHGLAMILNSLGVVLQHQGRFDEAKDTIQRSYDMLVYMDDRHGQAMTLNSLGGVLKDQGHLDGAEKAFRDSIEIGKRLDDKRGVAMNMSSLGGVLQRQGHLGEAEKAFRDSIDIRKKLDDEHGVAMTLNNLGGVLWYQRRFEEADEAFRYSIRIWDELGDKPQLAITHTKRGKCLYAWEKFEKAAAELCEGFRINESLKNRHGMDIVTPVLIKTFLNLGRADEALDYCQRALEITPTNDSLLKLRDRLSSPKKISHGTIKRASPHKRGYLHGFITADDGDADIYFREGYVGSVSLSDLVVGARVEVAFEYDPIGRRRATNIRLIV